MYERVKTEMETIERRENYTLSWKFLVSNLWYTKLTRYTLERSEAKRAL